MAIEACESSPGFKLLCIICIKNRKKLMFLPIFLFFIIFSIENNNDDVVDSVPTRTGKQKNLFDPKDTQGIILT